MSSGQDSQLPAYSKLDNYNLPKDKNPSNAPEYEETQRDSEIPHGWKFMFCHKAFGDMKVFVSKDSIIKYNSFKKTPKATDIQLQGIGVPLLFSRINSFSLHKVITIYKYFINPSTFKVKGFDPNTDFFQFCQITRYKHAQYKTYVLEFTPEPNNPKSRFEIVLFAHNVSPIIDYEFNGKFYRWINEAGTVKWKYSYGNYLLDYGQDCMARFWDRETYEIDMDRSRDNPLLQGFVSKFFNIRERYPREKYYSNMKLGNLTEKRIFSTYGWYTQRASLELNDLNYNKSHNTNYESIHSVSLEALISLSMALLFRREEEIEEEKRHSDNFGL